MERRLIFILKWKLLAVWNFQNDVPLPDENIVYGESSPYFHNYYFTQQITDVGVKRSNTLELNI